MPPRVVVDVDALRVSAAGYNVLTALEDRLLLSANASAMERWTRGTIAPPNQILKNSTKTFTYNYGRNFGYRPFIFIQVRWFQRTVVDVIPWISYYKLRDGVGGSLRITCDSSKFTVRHKAAADVFNFNYRFHYEIFDFPVT